MRRLAAPLLVLGTALFAGVFAACPGDIVPVACECTPCSVAIELTVVDAVSNGPITNFEIEVVLNDQAVGTPNGCQVEDREGNFCAFGFETGIYDLIVTAPGYGTREARVRQPERGSGNLCCQACLSPRLLTLGLDSL